MTYIKLKQSCCNGGCSSNYLPQWWKIDARNPGYVGTDFEALNGIFYPEWWKGPDFTYPHRCYWTVSSAEDPNAGVDVWKEYTTADQGHINFTVILQRQPAIAFYRHATDLAVPVTCGGTRQLHLYSFTDPSGLIVPSPTIWLEVRPSGE